MEQQPPPPPQHHFQPMDPRARFEPQMMPEPRVHEERRPAAAQHRLSVIDMPADIQEIRPRAERVKSASDVSSPAPDYLYYRLVKRGDDWTRASKEPISARVEEIARQARGRSDDGTVLQTMMRMRDLRRAQVEQLVRSVNERETGDARWEVAYIKSKRVITNGPTRKIQVPEMDIILARARPKIAIRSKSKSRKGSTAAGAGMYDLDDVKPRDKDKDKDKKSKDKKSDDDPYKRLRADSGMALLMDPISNLELFDLGSGRPRDQHGIMSFSGLPPTIPLERPIGERLSRKDSRSDRKGGKRSKSRDKGGGGGDPLMDGGELGISDAANAAAADIIIDDDDPVKERRRRRRRASSRSQEEHPSVVGEQQRSHSRHRSKSRGHRRSGVYIPGGYSKQYLDSAVASSATSSSVSDTSHYGYDEYADSSNTSLSTGQARRGSLARAQGEEQGGGGEKVYKVHQPGPTRRNTVHYDRPRQEYPGEVATVIPHRSSRGYDRGGVKYARYDAPVEARYAERPAEVRYERRYDQSGRPVVVRRETMPVAMVIPEERRIGSRDTMYADPPRGAELVVTRRHTDRDTRVGGYGGSRRFSYTDVPPVVDYPDEVVRAEKVEEYQRERVREEVLNMRERDLRSKERELEDREEELRRRRSRDEDERFREERRSRRGSLMRERAVFRDESTGELFIYED